MGRFYRHLPRRLKIVVVIALLGFLAVPIVGVVSDAAAYAVVLLALVSSFVSLQQPIRK